jgi:uncharacterized protein
LLVFLIVLVVAWRWRTWREASQLEKKNPTPNQASTADMVACRQCGLHVPAQEAVVGNLGSYCCTDHRLKLES